MEQADHTTAPTEKPRYFRRLSDKILLAFHQACDQNDHEIAKELLRLLEEMITRQPASNQRKAVDSLVAAHERLWLLQHPVRI